jgi:hypothetical protein
VHYGCNSQVCWRTTHSLARTLSFLDDCNRFFSRPWSVSRRKRLTLEVLACLTPPSDCRRTFHCEIGSSCEIESLRSDLGLGIPPAPPQFQPNGWGSQKNRTMRRGRACTLFITFYYNAPPPRTVARSRATVYIFGEGPCNQGASWGVCGSGVPPYDFLNLYGIFNNRFWSSFPCKTARSKEPYGPEEHTEG